MIRRIASATAVVFAGCVLRAGSGTKASPIDTPYWIDRLDGGGDAPKTAARWDRTLLVDSDFTPAERGAIADGAREWETALARDCGETIAFSLVDFPHGYAHVSGTTRVTRLSTREQLLAVCPYFNVQGIVACVAAETQDVFVVPDLVTAAYLPQLVAHELGHSIGLVHKNPPSVMTINAEEMSPPTADDAREFCEKIGVCRE
jgi:hypothetical protein